MHDLPAVRTRVRVQRRVRIDRHRMGHPAEQRQIVQRVAVEGGAAEAAEIQPQLFQPAFDAFDLALAEGRRAARLAGEFAVLLRGNGGDQMLDASVRGKLDAMATALNN